MRKLTRRAFIGTGLLASGALVIGVSIQPGNRSEKVAGLIADADEHVFDIWIKISPDNTVTIIVPHAEMGQGVHTTLALMLADELDADWDKVIISEAPAQEAYTNHMLLKGFVAGDIDFPNFLVNTVDGAFLKIGKIINFQVTGGSASIRFTGQMGMRIAGASTRQLLITAAAAQWQLPEKELSAHKSFIHHEKSGKKEAFFTFAQAAALLDPETNPTLKSVDQYQLMGTSPPRKDLPPKVTGEALYGMDIQLPGMKYASIKASPVFGCKVTSVDASSLKKIKGFYQVVTLDNAVAVIADGFWLAKQALNKVVMEFEKNDAQNIHQKGIFEQLRYDLNQAELNDDFNIDFKTGVIPDQKVTSKDQFEATYQVPFLAHATMEPMNCTAWIHDGICEIWIGSQNPLGIKSAVADLLDIDMEHVQVYNQYLGGGFGRRSETDVALQAAWIARETTHPIKLIWTREEDIQQDFYREANLSQFKAVLNSQGKPSIWINQFLFKHHPPEASIPPYLIPNQLIQHTESALHVPWGNWRSVDHSMHGFFIESFIDELAHLQNEDPFEYRASLLAHQPRFLKVLNKAAEKSSWHQSLPENWGRGIAIHQSFGTIVAEVVEVQIIEGKIHIERVVCVADAGFAMHRDAFIAQMESGIIYGLTAALYGEITIKNGAVEQHNFHDHKMLRMDETPIIETYIINSHEKIGGAGEPSTPVIAPALVNAIFNATGKRIRTLPIQNFDLSS